MPYRTHWRAATRPRGKCEQALGTCPGRRAKSNPVLGWLHRVVFDFFTRPPLDPISLIAQPHFVVWSSTSEIQNSRRGDSDLE